MQPYESDYQHTFWNGPDRKMRAGPFLSGGRDQAGHVILQPVSATGNAAVAPSTS
jgi:hypothetical protein